jgi:hypothetical protein
VSAIYSELCLALPSRRVVATSVRLRGTWLGWINRPGKMAYTARQICGVGRNILGNITPPAKSCRPGRSLAPPRSGFCWLLDGRTIIQLWCTQEKGTGSWRTLSPSAETDELGLSALNGAFRSAAALFRPSNKEIMPRPGWLATKAVYRIGKSRLRSGFLGPEGNDL